MIDRAREVVLAHPRHVLLGALVAGLLLAPLSPVAVLVAAAVALVLAGRPGVGVAAALAVVVGAALAQARIADLEGGPVPGLAGRTLAGPVELLEPVRERAHGTGAARVRLRSGPARGEVLAARILADSGWPRAAGVGSLVLVRGRVEPLAPFERYQRRRGALMALEVERARAHGTRGGPSGSLDAVRRRAERALSRGVSPPQAGLLRGMVLGQDEGLEEPVRDEFRRSGLAHLTAASGSNVMLLAALAIVVASLLGAGLRARLLVALALIVIYVPLAGGGPSIQRAGVMGVAGLAAVLAGRPASRVYALGLAAAVTLAINPRASGEPGWQLSFAAVVALLALAPPLRDWLGRRGAPAPLADATAITLAATLGTAPLMALHFEAVSLASLPANLAAAPAVAPVMWLGMLAAAVGQVSLVAATPLTWLAGLPVAYVEWIAHVAAGPGWASVDVRLPGPAAAVAGYGALLAAVLAVRRIARRVERSGRTPLGASARLAGGLAMVLSIAVGTWGVAMRADGPPRRPGELVVSFLDVGQGDAILLQHDATAVLFDTGPPGGPILRRLREAGVERLDALIITHGEADHEGMAPAVLRAHPARLVVDGGAGALTPVQRELPAAVARGGGRLAVPRAGHALTLGALELRFLWPPPLPPAGLEPGANPNDRAVVCHVRLGDFDLLLPADAESTAIAGVELPRVDALKVAHHGSDDPGLGAQLAALRPRVAVIPVGRNSYGHPTPSTLAALRAVPDVARTDRDGTVRLRVRGDRMELER